MITDTLSMTLLAIAAAAASASICTAPMCCTVKARDQAWGAQSSVYPARDEKDRLTS